MVSPANSQSIPIVTETKATPFAEEIVTLTKKDYIELKAEVGYWKGLYGNAQEKIKGLERQIEHWKGLYHKFRQRLFGKKSEKSSTSTTSEQDGNKKRGRGQQPGSTGHGRTQRPHLPVVGEDHDLPEDEQICRRCGGSFEPFGSEDSEILEIQRVSGYTRRVRRQRYKKPCTCPGAPGIIIAPPAPRVINKSPIGISIWVHILLGKYLSAQPLNRLLAALNEQGIPISPGTLSGGMQALMALFEPLMEALYRKQMSEDRFHADETRWEVFVVIAGKSGSRWYRWLMLSASVVYYRIDASRSAEVPDGHFAELAQEVAQAILVCDRYSAYKKLARLNSIILLAFCWTHVRRDFLDGARSAPKLEAWMLEWVSAIGEVSDINQQRLLTWNPEHTLDHQSAAFQEQQRRLQTSLDAIKERCDTLLHEDQQARAAKQDETLQREQRKVLQSLQNHWDGLTVFVDHPDVPMANNRGERTLRGPVCGRKNYWGSGSVWSAQFAAMMFSLLQTMGLWGINRDHWLSAYLTACANNDSQAPTDLSPFLPWEMDSQRRDDLSRPLITASPDPPDTS